jgi:signal transduction histidine kinase/CheY-like chemotaxis protein/HPt (histidine-containing phosphotransfer) domain-containing protein
MKTLNKSHFVFLLFFMSTALMVLVAAVAYFFIADMEESIEKVTQDHLAAAAKAASTLLTVEELDLFHAGGDTGKPEWEAIRARLQQFAEDYRVLYVYYWRDYGDGRIQYIIDNDVEEYMVTPELFYDLDSDPNTAEAVPKIMGGETWTSDLGSYTASWDGLISGVAPVFNADGSVYCAAGVDLSDEIILTKQKSIRVMRTVLLSSLLLSIISASLAMQSYRKKAMQSEYANKAKSQFLDTMSHEIRTPLNAVIGLSEIELQGELSEKSRTNVQQIHQSGSSLLGIINDILDISKIEAGGFELIPVDYETPPLIADTVNLNRVRIGSKPVTLVLEIADNFPRKLHGDELRIKQVLNNILSNAIKYTNEGTVTLNVTWKNSLRSGTEITEPIRQEALICFTIRDTGRGIRKEDIPKLFSGYTQFDRMENRKIEGTGLGLDITKKLIDMMGGAIVVESEYGKGSVFTITLVQGLADPAGIGSETAEKLRQHQYVVADKENKLARSWMPYGNVLVVDDMPVNLLVAKGLLEPYGLSMDFAVSGKEAIEKIQAQSYDLIFMDHMMPEMDGIEAVRVIRNWEAKQKIANNELPIIALTANALTGNAELFLSEGFSGFIAKPIDVAELDKALNYWIRDRQTPETLQQAEKTMIEKVEMTNDEPKHSTLDATHSPLPSFPGLDTAKGIAMTGGTLTGYRSVLSMFCKDAEKRLLFLQTAPSKSADAGAMKDFATQVHALKGALASIGAEEISAMAAELEAAAKAPAVDLTNIEKQLPVFTKRLAELLSNIHDALGSMTELPNTQISLPLPIPLLHELKAALKTEKADDIDHILDELNQKPLDPKTKDSLEQISDQVLMAEFDNAIIIVNELITTGNKG